MIKHRAKGGGKGTGKGGGKSKVAPSSTPRIQADVIIDQEDRASMIRKIQISICEHRPRGVGIARALIAPVRGIREEREQLRYLQHAHNVSTSTLFKRKKDDDTSSETASLLSSIDPSDPTYPYTGETLMESLMSMVALQSTMIVVAIYALIVV